VKGIPRCKKDWVKGQIYSPDRDRLSIRDRLPMKRQEA